MAVIYCHECDTYIDDDTQGPCEVEYNGNLICPDCAERIAAEKDADDDRTWSQVCSGATLKRSPNND